MTNYLGAQNPFNLVSPPEWFLQALFFRDPDLVILPGMSQPVYRLARRVKRSLGLMTAALGHDSETARMIKHRLVPVTSIMPYVTWGPQVFQWLDERDVWAVGGSENAAVRMSENDDAARQELLRREASEADARGGAGYRALKIRDGKTVFVHRESPAGAESTVHAGTGA